MRKLFTIPMMVVGWAVIMPLLFIYALFAVCVGLVGLALDYLTGDNNNNNRKI